MKELWLQFCSRLLTDLHNIHFSAQQGLQNAKLGWFSRQGFAFIFPAMWRRQEDKLGLIPLKSLSLIYITRHLKGLLYNVRRLLQVLAKVNSIYDPSYLSTHLSTWMQTKRKVTAATTNILEKGFWFMFLTADWISHLTALNPNKLPSDLNVITQVVTMGRLMILSLNSLYNIFLNQVLMVQVPVLIKTHKWDQSGVLAKIS